MYIRRKISPKIIFRFAWKLVLFFTLWSGLVTHTYLKGLQYGINLSIPFLPLSTIGVAVAFYLGFKNNQSYDRLWEARKIWGGIINHSRIWGNQILSFLPDSELREQKQLIYRHLAWTNALRLQLRQSTIQKNHQNLSYRPDFQLQDTEDSQEALGQFLEPNEYQTMLEQANMATQLIRKQGKELKRLSLEGKINDLRHMALMNSLNTLYELQGKCERIKNTPFPRQFAFYSTVFVWIFIGLLPIALVGEFAKLGSAHLIWLNIPFSTLISWIFITMEVVGDNSEDPFENYINDVPMTALCRTIEIDLKQMLGETDLPEQIKAENGILL